MARDTLGMFWSLSGWLVAFVLLAILYLKSYQPPEVTTGVLIPSARDGSIDGNDSPRPINVNNNPIPKDDKLLSMTTAELEEFLHTYVARPQFKCSKLARMGATGNGGWWVCLDAPYAPDPSNCLVYSFGINYEWSFDDAMEKYGCEVHSFDPSMLKSEDHLRGERIYFHLEGVGGDNLVHDHHSKGQWQLYTFGTIRSRLGHVFGRRRVDVVKMDVEGDEFQSIPQALREGSLRDVPQMGFELHDQGWRDGYLKGLPILRDLYDHGMRIVLTDRNRRTDFQSPYFRGVKRSFCLEMYMVNVTLAKIESF